MQNIVLMIYLDFSKMNKHLNTCREEKSDKVRPNNSRYQFGLFMKKNAFFAVTFLLGAVKILTQKYNLIVQIGLWEQRSFRYNFLEV